MLRLKENHLPPNTQGCAAAPEFFSLSRFFLLTMSPLFLSFFSFPRQQPPQIDVQGTVAYASPPSPSVF